MVRHFLYTTNRRGNCDRHVLTLTEHHPNHTKLRLTLVHHNVPPLVHPLPFSFFHFSRMQPSGRSQTRVAQDRCHVPRLSQTGKRDWASTFGCESRLTWAPRCTAPQMPSPWVTYCPRRLSRRGAALIESQTSGFIIPIVPPQPAQPRNGLAMKPHTPNTLKLATFSKPVHDSNSNW